MAATQNPTAEMLGNVNIKRNMIRLVGRVDSGDAARVAAGVAGSGAEHLTGAGDMLLVVPGQMRRLTTALLSEKDIDQLPRTELGRRLDLDQYDDIDHVAAIAGSNGRPPDPLEPEQVYTALIEPEISLNELYRRFNIGRAKQKAVKLFAAALLELMAQDGYELCRRERPPEGHSNHLSGVMRLGGTICDELSEYWPG